MAITQNAIISAAVFFVSIYLSGIWLKKSGKPYSGFKLNLHKFISLGALAYLGREVVLLNKAGGLSAAASTMSIVTAGMFAFTIISGGLVSIEKEMAVWVRWLHKLAPYLTVLSTAISLYLILV